MRSRAVVVASVAVLVLILLRAFGGEPKGIPLLYVSQGVSVRDVDGERVFIIRDGSVVTAFLAKSGALRAQVQWCPREELFWSPETNDLFTRAGKWVFGPAPHDMVQPRTNVTQDLVLEIDVRKRIAPKRSNGREDVDPELYEFYQRYLNYDPSQPQPTRPVFCPDPLT
ncbi:MAG TPA: hypothetical protein VM600_06795 [Actinomycetota bacterium]|nr:hypothetical protein [Actinomycetota bacterium]